MGEHAEHLQNANAAGAGRRRSNDVIAVVIAFERRAEDGPITCKISAEDEAAASFHGLRQFSCRLALVEVVRPLSRDALQGGGQFRLPEDLALLVGASAT